MLYQYESVPPDASVRTAGEPVKWWASSLDEVLSKVESGASGLSTEQARRRRAEHGPNTIERQPARSWLLILLDQFKSAIIGILAIAAVAAFAFDKKVEAIAVAAVIVANTLIGFFTELHAVRRMESLAELGKSTVSVRRDDRRTVLDTEDVVPGDIVIVEEGLEVPADMRLLETNRVLADESTLTGESEPVAKQSEPVDADAPLAERARYALQGYLRHARLRGGGGCRDRNGD
jgi:Ca2+-transporting ATPase